MSYEVVAGELRTHAGHLDDLMERLDTAVSAANTVSMDDRAYGLLCAFLPPIINPMEQEGVAALTAACEAMGTTAGNIRATAESYEETDRVNAETFDAMLPDAKPTTAAGSAPLEPFTRSGPARAAPAEPAAVAPEPFSRDEPTTGSAEPVVAPELFSRSVPMTESAEPVREPLNAPVALQHHDRGEPMGTPAHLASVSPEPFDRAESLPLERQSVVRRHVDGAE